GVLTSDRPKATGAKLYGSPDYWSAFWQSERPDRMEPRRFIVGTVLDLARNHAPSVLVELGCGGNPMLDVLHAFVPDATCIGFDFSAPVQDYNSARHPMEDWRVGDVTRGLDIEDGAADFVVSSHVIEHMDDPYQFIEECLRICKPG